MGEKPTEVDETEAQTAEQERYMKYDAPDKRTGGTIPIKGEGERLDFKGGEAGLAVTDEGAPGEKSKTKTK